MERPASSGDTLELRPFSGSSDADIFAVRTEEVGQAGDGSGAPAGVLEDELQAALARIDDEEAAWFVAVEGPSKVGIVFGELVDGEVNVRIWVHPDHRKKGYGTAALRKSRSVMAAYFPAVPMVVRAPGVDALSLGITHPSRALINVLDALTNWRQFASDTPSVRAT